MIYVIHDFVFCIVNIGRNRLSLLYVTFNKCVKKINYKICPENSLLL